MKKILQGVGSFLIALCLLELGARAAGTFFREDEDPRNRSLEWFVDSPELGWERKPNFRGYVAGVMRTFDSEGFLAGDSAKLADTLHRKILFVGDSNTFGNDQPVEYIFASLVDSLMPEAVTINAGVMGYTSYQGLVLLRRMLTRCRPDAVVVSFNYNDRRYVLDRKDKDSPEYFLRAFDAMKREERERLLERFYIYRALRFVLRTLGLTSVVQPPLFARADTLTARVPPEEFRAHLSAMACEARQHGVSLIFLLLKDNPVQTERLYRGLELLARGNRPAAKEQLLIASREPTVFRMLASIHLAQILREDGDTLQANNVLTFRHPPFSLQGGYVLYRDSDYNAILREVASQFVVPVVDAGAVLDAHPWVYYDLCHFDTTGHRLVAEALVPALRQVLGQSGRSVASFSSVFP